jgi:hypothetical protein
MEPRLRPFVFAALSQGDSKMRGVGWEIIVGWNVEVREADFSTTRLTDA